jgi:hypothetical protein
MFYICGCVNLTWFNDQYIGFLMLIKLIFPMIVVCGRYKHGWWHIRNMCDESEHIIYKQPILENDGWMEFT